MPKSARISILCGINDQSHDFIETMRLNTGFSCRLFRDKAAAIAWLQKSN